MRWTKIEGSFIATGNEQFITIGNFNDNAHTNKVPIAQNSYNVFFPDSSAIYLIDDVSVVESGTKADAGPDTHVGYGDSVYIGLPSSEAIWNSWSVLGSSTVIGEGPGIWVKPTVTTSYVVTQTLCGHTTRDTVEVQVWPAGVSGSVGGRTQGYSISPNPNSGSFVLRQAVAENKALNVEVQNVMGQIVFKGKPRLESGHAGFVLHNLPEGMYYLHVADAGRRYTLKFLKQ